MTPEGKMKWDTSTEQVDGKKEAEHKEAFSNIPAENLPNTIYEKIITDGGVESKLNNKYMNIAGAKIEVKIGLAGAPSKTIKFEIDADKANFTGALQNEINEQIASLGLQGGQKIEYLNIDLQSYEQDDKGEKVNFNGGYRSLI